MLRYIARSFSEAAEPYYPSKDLWKRAQIDMWLDFYGTDFRPHISKVIFPLFGQKGKKSSAIDPEVKKRW